MKKYKIPVRIVTRIDHIVGYVECDTVKEFERKANALWESKSFDAPTPNVYNDFEMGEWDIESIKKEDLKFYKNKKE